MNSSPTVVRGYDRLAPWYDPLATVYSGGRIAACHRTIAEQLTPGERALFVGAGNGRDAAAAARRGVIPTLLDLSPGMLARATRKVRESGIEPTIVARDVREVHCARDPRDPSTPPPFDAVVASFFLNVFRTDELPDLIAHLATLVGSGGRIWIADFAPPRGGGLSRLGQRIYHDCPMRAFGALTGNAIHPIHDLRPEFERTGITLASTTTHRVFGVGPRWLEVLEGVVG